MSGLSYDDNALEAPVRWGIVGESMEIVLHRVEICIVRRIQSDA